MILTSWDKYRNFGLLALRVGLGGMMAVAHGWGKITGGPESWEGLGSAIGALGVPVFLPAFWGFMAAFAEFVGAILLAVGFFFRPAAFLLLCTMIVAAAMHATAGDDFGMKTSRPIELGIVFLAMLFTGPGRYAVDTWFGGKRG